MESHAALRKELVFHIGSGGLSLTVVARVYLTLCTAKREGERLLTQATSRNQLCIC